MKLNIDKVYVCHYSKLTERKEKLIKQFQFHNIENYEFVECYDKDNWDKNQIRELFPKMDIDRTGGTCSLNDAEKSLLMKHCWIINDMHKNNYESVMVFEDDVVLVDNFVELFNEYKKEMPEDWDIGWVGSCFNLKEPQRPGKRVYKTSRGSRCTHAFCLSNSFAKKVIHDINNADEAADWYYNKIIKQFDLNNYWFQPALAFQSLEFTSAISGNKWTPDIVG